MACNVLYQPLMLSAAPYLPGRRGSTGMPVLTLTVRIMKHVINPGDKFGRLTVIAEVQKAAADGKRYRAAVCRCDCGRQTISHISSLISGGARSCGCSRGPPKYQEKHCPVCGTLALIRRDYKSCSRACGYQLARAARQATNPSYDVWHRRVTTARGPASGYPCADCGNPAQDWSTADPSSDDLHTRFQPRCRRCHRHYDDAGGEGTPGPKLTSEKESNLRPRGPAGRPNRQPPAEFGISDATACAAVNRKTWAHVS